MTFRRLNGNFKKAFLFFPAILLIHIWTESPEFDWHQTIIHNSLNGNANDTLPCVDFSLSPFRYQRTFFQISKLLFLRRSFFTSEDLYRESFYSAFWIRKEVETNSIWNTLRHRHPCSLYGHIRFPLHIANWRTGLAYKRLFEKFDPREANGENIANHLGVFPSFLAPSLRKDKWLLFYAEVEESYSCTSDLIYRANILATPRVYATTNPSHRIKKGSHGSQSSCLFYDVFSPPRCARLRRRLSDRI